MSNENVQLTIEAAIESTMIVESTIEKTMESPAEAALKAMMALLGVSSIEQAMNKIKRDQDPFKPEVAPVKVVAPVKEVAIKKEEEPAMLTEREMFPLTLQRTNLCGFDVAVVGSSEILEKKLVAISVSLKSSQEGVKASKEEASNIAANNQTNLIVMGAHKDETLQAINACLESGGDVVIVIPFGINKFQFDPFRRYIYEGRVVIIFPLKPDAVQNAANTQVANDLIAKMASHLFVAECYATKKYSDGTRESKVWDLAQRFHKEGKAIFIPALHEKSRAEHVDLIKELGAIQLVPQTEEDEQILNVSLNTEELN